MFSLVLPAFLKCQTANQNAVLTGFASGLSSFANSSKETAMDEYIQTCKKKNQSVKILAIPTNKNSATGASPPAANATCKLMLKASIATRKAM